MTLEREVRKLAAPAIAHSLLQTLVFVVDRAMLGQHASSALAAMQIAGALEWSVWSVFAAFEVGTIARVGRHVGAGEHEAARRAALVSLAIAIGMGLVLAASTPLVLASLGHFAPKASPASLGEAKAYLAVTLLASPVVFVAVTGIATLQAGGDTRTPLAIGVLSNIVHIGLNAALIPRWGTRGCGISTAVTFAIEAGLTMLVLSRSRFRSRGGAGPAWRDESRAVVRVALPALFERVLYHTGFLGFALLITELGDTAMAANQALISAEAVCFLSADGFGVAAAALVAQKIGAKKPGDAVRAAKIATRDAVIALTVLGAVFLVARQWVLPVFSKDADVVKVGLTAVPLLAIAQPFLATSIVVGQALRGAGFTREVLVVSALSALCVRLFATWGFGLALGLGLVGVWMGSTTDWLTRTVLLLWIGGRRSRTLQTGRE